VKGRREGGKLKGEMGGKLAKEVKKENGAMRKEVVSYLSSLSGNDFIADVYQADALSLSLSCSPLSFCPFPCCPFLLSLCPFYSFAFHRTLFGSFTFEQCLLK